MKKIDKPNYSVKDVLSLCIESKRTRRVNEALANNLEQILPTVECNENNYIDLASQESLYIINSEEDINGIVSAEEMVDLYDNTFVKSKKTRHIYDKIRSVPKNETCPFCSQRKVSTLDHYLPKSKHPSFAVAPCNLLPSCPECNKIKTSYQAATAEGQLLHPYFDDVNNGRWLYANVIETTPPALIFRVEPPKDWPALKIARIMRHFDILELGKLYSVNVGTEIAGMEHMLKYVYEKNGADGVRLRLRENSESWFRVHSNSWQGVMYEALAMSDWFCENWIALS